MFSPDSLTAKNQTLQELLSWRMESRQARFRADPIGLPPPDSISKSNWTSSTVAEMKKLSPEQQKVERDLMFQNLLADQFKVAIHRESRLLPGYALVIAKNGPKVQPSKPGDTYPNGIKGPDGLPGGPHKFAFGPDGVIVQALAMSFVAESLATHLGQPVVDRTGLTGDYDFTLKWPPRGGTAVETMGQTGKQENGTMPGNQLCT